jgi:hypothetical protein
MLHGAVVLLFVTVLITPGAGAVLSSVPPGDPTVGISEFHQIIMMQGDDPDTTEVEKRLQLTVVDRAVWRIPIDSDEVYTYVPPMATNVLMDNVESFSHQGQTFFIPGPYSFANNPMDQPEVGIVQEGDYAGFHYWRFPIFADRNLLHPLSFNSTADFEDADPALTTMGEWNTSNGNLSLSDEKTSATYISKKYTGGVGLVSVNMTFKGEDEQNMTIEVSADNGTTWKPAESGSPVSFDDEGNEFRWRVTMTQNMSLNETPVLEVATFDIVLIPESTSIWIETSYVIDIPTGGVTFDMVFPFDVEASGMIYLGHFDNDMDLIMTGTEVTEDVDGTYVGKTQYSHMTGGYSDQLILEVEDLVVADDGVLETWMLFAIPFALLFGLILVLVAVSARRKEQDGQDGTTVGLVNDDEDPRFQIEQLKKRKTELVIELKELDDELRDGHISKEDHEVRRAEVKAEAVAILRQIEERSKDD